MAAAVAVAAGLVSVGRLLLTNSSALSNLVWAEDGLFPLCVRGHGVVPCLVDPFAGYLLFLPRVVAWPVSLMSMDAWPMATNVAAALLAAAAAVLAFVVVRRSGGGTVAAAFIGLIPVVVPIVGVEAINATGSSYMLLVYVAALAICFPRVTDGPTERFPTTAYAIGALVTALTIPSSAVLLIALGLQMARRRVALRSGLIVGGAMVVGLAVQALVAVTADNPRPIDFTWAALRSWVDTMPSALLTFWPGSASLDAAGSFAVVGGTDRWGVLLIAVVLVLGVVLVCLRNAVANGVGLLLVIGAVMGAVPAAAGYANNRYFVIPVLLWTAAAIMAIDRLLPRWREAVVAVIAVVLLAVWSPSLPASDFRATAVPEWTPMLDAARAACAAAPDGTVAITFSPNWPFVDAVFPGPTNNVVPCSVLPPLSDQVG